jgi:transcriptional antiterminator RfaH
MDWYVIHTKPRQELRAQQNLSNQGYEAYLPLMSRQKLRRGLIEIAKEPLFPRYLFIRLDATHTGKSWGPIRSTLGVSTLVSFGGVPAKAPDSFIEALKRQADAVSTVTKSIYQAGDKILITSGPFAGIEGVFQMDDGESRAMLLIEMLSKSTQINVPLATISKCD